MQKQSYILLICLMGLLMGCGTTPATPAPTPTRPTLTVDNFEPIHASYIQEFIDSPGFGISRVEVNPYFHELQPFMVNGAPYEVLQVELISLLEHNPPVVYRTPGLPGKGRLPQTATRPLTALEQTALQTLQAGEKLTLTPTETDLRVFGAIRAQSDCLECHEVEIDDLLGVFSYHLQAVVTDTTKM